MARGFSLSELMIVMAVVGLLALLGWSRIGSALDRIAVNRAASDVTMAIAVTRHQAIALGSRARLVIRSDSLLLDTAGAAGWFRSRAWAGPAGGGVTLAVTNPTLVFSGTGLAWGVGNTRITLARGPHVETITTSRVGRVKRW